MEFGFQDLVNIKLDFKVYLFFLVLNKIISEFVKVNVFKLVVYLEMIEGDLVLQGSIGSLFLSDFIFYGEFYREWFIISGEEVFIFQIFKYGWFDFLFWREYDICVSFWMVFVQYVYIQCFQVEVVVFIQYFIQL